MGWINDNKGIDILVEAMNNIRERLGEFRVLVCGRGPAEESIRKKVTALNLTEFFEFRGWVIGDEKNKSFLETDIFVLPSYKEGLPNALLEAMAYGLPVITTPVGAIPEVIVDGMNGILVNPGNITELGTAILTLFQDNEKRKQMGENARKTILANHDIENSWGKILNALDITR